jgi:broad specificity phosphatase PhoE
MQAFLRHRQQVRSSSCARGGGAPTRRPATPIIPPRIVVLSSCISLTRPPTTTTPQAHATPQGDRRDVVARAAANSGSSGNDNDDAAAASTATLAATVAVLAAELRALREEVKELREQAQAQDSSPGFTTVRGMAEGRRFLSVTGRGDSDDEGDEGEAGARWQQRGRGGAASPSGLIGDADGARLASAAAAGRTGGLAVIGEEEEEEEGVGEERQQEQQQRQQPQSQQPTPRDPSDRLFDDDTLPRPRRSGSRSPSPRGGVVLPPTNATTTVVVPTPVFAPPTPAALYAAKPPSSQQQQQQQQQQKRQGGIQGARMTLEEFRSLPEALFLVRHAESMGNADMDTYASTPDYAVVLSERGYQQAIGAGAAMRQALDARYGGPDGYRLFFYVSPYTRTRQTFIAMRQAFNDRSFAGVEESILIREQEFSGGLQTERIRQDLEDRLRYGRFFYRFPQGGESTADVFVRTCIFEDELLRALRSGRHGDASHVVVVGHGIQLRVLMMRLLGWTVESFLQVHNPPNATPLALEKVSERTFERMSSRLNPRASLQVRQVYRLSASARRALRMDSDLSSSTMDLLNQQFT